MVESLVSLSLMAIVGTAVLSGISTTHISGAVIERQSEAENIARNQMASVFSSAYVENSGDYLSVATPGNYLVVAGTEEVDALSPDADMQKVVVTVSFDGSTVFELETIRLRP